MLILAEAKLPMYSQKIGMSLIEKYLDNSDTYWNWWQMENNTSSLII